MALTRKQMEEEIDAGRGILYNGVPITRKEDLPSVAALAKGNPTATAASRADLEAQQAAIAAQLAELDSPGPQPDDGPAAEDKPPTGRRKKPNGAPTDDADTGDSGDGAQT